MQRSVCVCVFTFIQLQEVKEVAQAGAHVLPPIVEVVSGSPLVLAAELLPFLAASSILQTWACACSMCV